MRLISRLFDRRLDELQVWKGCLTQLKFSNARTTNGHRGL